MVRLGDMEYTLEFKHLSVDGEDRTACIISSRNGAVRITGVVQRHYLDKQNLVVARRAALTKALASFSRDERREFWTVYEPLLRRPIKG